MAALCNDSTRCEILNLGWEKGGHGPYLVRQVGYAPGAVSLRNEPFILQRDGRWLLNLAFAALPEAEQEAQLFHSLATLSQFLDSQQGTPVRADTTLPADKDAAELLREFESCTRRILRGMRNCLTTQAGQ
jgi:hypothetical protein